jgi:hypothetical protein
MIGTKFSRMSTSPARVLAHDRPSCELTCALSGRDIRPPTRAPTAASATSRAMAMGQRALQDGGDCAGGSAVGGTILLSPVGPVVNTSRP